MSRISKHEWKCYIMNEDECSNLKMSSIISKQTDKKQVISMMMFDNKAAPVSGI